MTRSLLAAVVLLAGCEQPAPILGHPLPGTFLMECSAEGYRAPFQAWVKSYELHERVVRYVDHVGREHFVVSERGRWIACAGGPPLT